MEHMVTQTPSAAVRIYLTESPAPRDFQAHSDSPETPSIVPSIQSLLLSLNLALERTLASLERINITDKRRAVKV